MGCIANATTKPEEHDIEITPEMIEAGRWELIEYDNRFKLPQDAAARIFRAMTLVSPSGFKYLER